MGAPRIRSVIPILDVKDVRAAVAFYVTHLGFQEEFIMPDSSYGVVRYGRSIRIHLARSDDTRRLTATKIGSGLFLEVENLDVYWRQVVASSPPTRFRSMERKPWGMLEFHILDLDGCLLRFGEEDR